MICFCHNGVVRVASTIAIPSNCDELCCMSCLATLEVLQLQCAELFAVSVLQLEISVCCWKNIQSTSFGYATVVLVEKCTAYSPLLRECFLCNNLTLSFVVD